MAFFSACLWVLAASASASSIHPLGNTNSGLKPRATPCENTAKSRACWGEYSIDTNYYDVTPTTKVTREYWLSVEEGPCAPDGYNTTCMTFNGTVPGPQLTADWGDALVIHVTNNMVNNGTAIHWHGLRQLNTVAYDGVPGVTQCPIAPGTSMTYSFRVDQYGSTWYHSHFSLQYSVGLYGPLILNGPSTADWDEDLGVLFLSDWSHISAFALWGKARQGAPPTLENGLINGANTYNCTSTDACQGVVGSKFETVFTSGKKYRIRLINVAIEGHFQFSVDGHNMTVMANDLVPIVPYNTDNVLVSIGQRYDVVIEANAAAGNYWLRAGWVSACSANLNPDGMTGIVRYDNSSTAQPTSKSSVTTVATCGDEPSANLVPHLSLDVGNITNSAYEELSFKVDTHLKWTINSSSFLIDWSSPTLVDLIEGKSIFPSEYNVVPVQPLSTSGPEWAMLVIQDQSGLGLFHPVHLHGHDFWVLAQETGVFNAKNATLDLSNPPRRDVASLPGNGYLAIAFKLDNPGIWLAHCHVAWHSSAGFSLEFIESEAAIVPALSNLTKTTALDTCASWKSFIPPFPQEDSGI